MFILDIKRIEQIDVSGYITIKQNLVHFCKVHLFLEKKIIKETLRELGSTYYVVLYKDKF